MRGGRHREPGEPAGGLGQRLAGLAPRVAMLVMGDASAKKAIGVPGAPGPEAEEYDAAIAAALAAADAGALARLDPDRAAELRVTGRAPGRCWPAPQQPRRARRTACAGSCATRPRRTTSATWSRPGPPRPAAAAALAG